MIKKILLTTLILIMPAAHLLADEIYTDSGNIIRCRITKITSRSIMYTGENEVAGTVSRREVEKIVYDNQKEIVFYDLIYFTDGSNLQVYILSLNDKYIEYKPVDGTSQFERIEVSTVEKIIYRDGETGLFGNSGLKADYNEIFLRDGSRVRADRISVGDRFIEFINGSGKHEIIGRKFVLKIVYLDGRVQHFDASGNPDIDISAPARDAYPGNLFMEFELGWNGYTGLGARLDYRLIGGLTMNAGAGLGMWGYRFSGGFRYFFNYPYGLALCAGAAYNTGDDMKLDTQVDTPGGIVKEEVTFECKPVTCLNMSLLFSWCLFGDGRFYVETGYSYALTKEKYTYETISGYPMTKEEKETIDLMAPGGVIITLGYAFAF